MVRLETLDEFERNMLMKPPSPSSESRPCVTGPPLQERRIGVITTAGLHLRHDRPFQIDPNDFYRVIPGDVLRRQ